MVLDKNYKSLYRVNDLKQQKYVLVEIIFLHKKNNSSYLVISLYCT